MTLSSMVNSAKQPIWALISFRYGRADPRYAQYFPRHHWVPLAISVMPRATSPEAAVLFGQRASDMYRIFGNGGISGLDGRHSLFQFTHAFLTGLNCCCTLIHRLDDGFHFGLKPFDDFGNLFGGLGRTGTQITDFGCDDGESPAGFARAGRPQPRHSATVDWSERRWL